MALVSVALCTYNGGRYLNEQLASIAAQTHPVDELVIGDDGSTDNTIQIIEEFARHVSFPVRVEINQPKLGSSKNFERVLSQCKGDILLLSDQDDRWRSDRVAKTVEFFENFPDMDAVFSNARVINDASLPMPTTIWEKVSFTESLRQKWKAGKAYEILFNGYVVTGATLAIRRRALAQVVPFPTLFADLIHDGWIAMLLALKGTIGFIEEELISYRQHTAQQVGFGRKKTWVSLKERFTRPREEKLGPIQHKAAELVELYAILSQKTDLPAKPLDYLRHLRDHFRIRAALPASRWKRLVPILGEVKRGRYQFSSQNRWWLPALGDFFE